MAAWMHLSIEVPEEEGLALLMLLKEKLDFEEIDHCELQRFDRARVSYGPSEPRTESGYTIDPFPRTPESRGPSQPRFQQHDDTAGPFEEPS